MRKTIPSPWEKSATIDRLETSATIVQRAMLLADASTYNDRSLQEIDQSISEAKSHLKEFRMAYLNLSETLGDGYSQEQFWI